MATKPVKVLTDLLTKKQIIKQDADGNILFNVSGVLGNGHVSSSLPITSSFFIGDGRYLTNISGSGGINSVYTSGNISGSGLEVSPIFLKDPLNIGTITSSYIYSPQITGSLYGTSSFALTASYAQNTISTVYTSGSVIGSGTIVSPIRLKDDITLISVTATFNGNLIGNAATATTASFASSALTASYILNAVSSSFSTNALTASFISLALDSLTDVSASSPVSGNYLRYNGSSWIAEDASILTSSNTVIQPLYHSSGVFNSQSTIELQLPTGSGGFPVTDLDRIIYSLVIKETTGSNWNNDLASVEFKVSASHIYAVISAPSLPYAYSFNALNQNVSSSYTYTQSTASYALTAAYAENFANITINYNNLRELVTGAFDFDGTKTIELQKFNSSDLEYLTFDVLTKASGTDYYTNDLLSFNVSGNISNKISIYLSAPSYGVDDRYRIIAVKETGSF